MSLRDLNIRTRRRLRLHGWLLTLWCVAIGVATSWLLLRAFHLRAPAARYAISAVAMYSVGLVVGTRVWLGRFHAAAQGEAALGHADAKERAAFDAEQGDDRRNRKKNVGEKFDWGFGLLDIADLFSLGELSVFLLVPALLLIALGVVLMLGYAPMLLADGVAALLAEMAVQFVFGALLVRGVMRPRGDEDPFLHIVGRTWFVGLLLVVASAAAGWLLTAVDPGAASIADLFRHGGPR